eukprot:TRINITY_DN13557_c0_g2_i1.p2 TRINITY_DN13557_c0_g2~~TRINITY_DN13557_c0_g2_i1.p2  ORF type:complete len:206 (+),score=17.51 TRINITY_DN13557_c0_g2_i1:651-1268(+)
MAPPAAAKMYSAQGPHTVGVEEIDGLKAAANNLYTEGKFGQAIIGYSYAIKQMATLIVPSARRASTNLDSPAAVAQAVKDARPDPRHAQMAAILYSNRAAAYIKLEKFDKAATDAGAATVIDPSNFKAWLRKAMAHKELYQWYECHVAVKHATRLEPTNDDARSLLEESQYKMASGAHMAAAAPPPPSPPVVESHPRKKFGLFRR